MENNNVLVGIDFGTTNTVISYYNNGKIKILKNYGKHTIPTLVYIDKHNKIACGYDIPINLDNHNTLISSFKTKIGQNINLFESNNKKWNVKDILLIYFTYLKKIIESNLKSNKISAVISVPSNFNDNQREIIKQIFSYVGLNIIRVINEPTAAALAYGFKKTNTEQTLLVIDLGGGTLDLSILEIDDNFYEVINTIGDNQIGGDNFTQVIYLDLLDSIKEKSENISLTQAYLKKLWFKCQKCKERLTYLETSKFKITLPNNDILEYTLTNDKLKKLSKNIISKILLLFEQIKLNNDISCILLVGGSSKLKIFQSLILQEFNQKPFIHKELHTVVARGSCYYGAYLENILEESNDIVVIDVLPLSLGIETADGNFSVIIPRNTPLPTKRTQKYTTDTPSDTEVIVKVYQGERKIAIKNSLVGEIKFDKVSLGGIPVVEITFKVNLNGMIQVCIKDKRSGKEQNVLFKDSKNWNNDEIQQLILSADKYITQDEEEFTKRNLVYSLQIRIEQLLDSVKFNNLMKIEDKTDLINFLNDKYDLLTECTNPELLKIKNELNDRFVKNNDFNEDEDENDNHGTIEDIILQEKIEDLETKLNQAADRDDLTDIQIDFIIEVNEFLSY